MLILRVMLVGDAHLPRLHVSGGEDVLDLTNMPFGGENTAA